MMSNEKVVRTLSGALMRPLAVGTTAIIFHDGKFTRTSRIVAIHSYDAEEACFETLNTKYHC